MPIVASRAGEIRRRLAELADPKTRPGAILRLKVLGPRVPPHVQEDLARMPPDVRAAIGEVLRDVDTADARAILRKLGTATAKDAASDAREALDAASERAGRASTIRGDAEAEALEQLRAVPPPRVGEAASLSRRRGEAHLLLARTGSRLARKDLLACLSVVGADRGRLYCEAAALIGDTDFLPALAAMAIARPDSGAPAAIAAIARREKLTARSKALKSLEPELRTATMEAIAAPAGGRLSAPSGAPQ